MTDFRHILKISSFMKIRPVGAELSHEDERTDVTKLVVPYRNFTNAPKMPKWLKTKQTSYHIRRLWVFIRDSVGRDNVQLHRKQVPLFRNIMPPPSSCPPTLTTETACYYQSLLSTYTIANWRNSEDYSSSADSVTILWNNSLRLHMLCVAEFFELFHVLKHPRKQRQLALDVSNQSVITYNLPPTRDTFRNKAIDVTLKERNKTYPH